jgi:pullulanase/glycogen debranching enzyme
MLRTKPNPKAPNGFDHNSYMSSDEVNNLKWNTLSEDSNEYKMMQYYAGLCAIRTKMSIFTHYTSFIAYNHNGNSGFNIIIKDGNGGEAVIVFNPHRYQIGFSLPQGTFYTICDGTNAGLTNLKTVSGQINIPSYSAQIFVNDVVLNSVSE